MPHYRHRLRGAGRAGLVGLCCLMLNACTPNPGESNRAAADAEPATLAVTNAFVYTADANRRVTEAIAVRGNSIIAVGSNAQIEALIGPDTRVLDANGRMVLPGLHDSHVHLAGIVPSDICDLASEPKTLAQLVEHLRGCIEKEALAPGEWLAVESWNFTEGNTPTEQYPTLRAALDDASREHPIFLRGNDGHHGGVNSAALALARNAQGTQVGLSAATLASDFAAHRAVIGVDARGEPNGKLDETARALVAPESVWAFSADIAALAPAINRKLAVNGITSAQDTWIYPEMLPPWHAFEREGGMTFRLHAALFPRLEEYLADPLSAAQTRHPKIDIPRLIADLSALRQAQGAYSLISANAVKLFMDGVIEGNPYSNPPGLPNAAVLEPYKQPQFRHDPQTGDLQITGYVDPQDERCAEVQANGVPSERSTIDAFMRNHGFHPAQCIVSRGVLEHPQPFIAAYVQALDQADFTIHAHAIGDRAARLAIDAFEAARQFNPDSALPHNIAHAQLVHPEDQARAGKLGLYVTFTYAWIRPDRAYDMTVTPFLTQTSNERLYEQDNTFMRDLYPAGSMQAAGVTLVAGSDAPVDTPEPRPFVNLQQAVTRSDGEHTFNASQRLDIHSAIAAFTINGARALRQQDIVGSLEVGKLADLIVIDQNLIELVQAQQAHNIANTQVLTTVFNGKVVYEKPN